MIKGLLAALGILGGASLLCGAGPTVLFEENFDSPVFKGNWTAKGSGGVFDPAEKAVRFTSEKPGEDYLTCTLDELKFRGKRVQLDAMVKGKDLSQSATAHFNSKLKMSFDTKSEGERNPEALRKTGTYDWWMASKIFVVPEDASNIRITIGLQDVTGSYWVKNLKVTDIPVYAGQPYTPSTEPVQKTTKYRGVDTSRNWTEQDFIDLKKWNVNLIRYQMRPLSRKIPIDTRERFMAWIETEIKKVDAFLVLTEKYGMKAVLDMQAGVGTNTSQLGSNLMSFDIKDQDLLVDVWCMMAAHYKGNKSIYAYDILNEPREEGFVYFPGGGVEWQQLVERAIKAIREIDTETPILVEAASWSGPNGFMALKPINGKNLIYSAHFYSPGLFTHQNINVKVKNKYPGKIDEPRKDEYWDKERLRKELEPVIAFQKKYNVPIYVGEFGVVCWAEGADQWLKDVVDIFEEYGWDWTYHAFREYEGWSLEYEGDQQKFIPSSDNSRKSVMLNFFSRNK